MLSKSCNIIMINNKNEILLHLRDNKPTIPFPNTWVLPGGYIEDGETSEQCIIREMKEELNIEFKEINLFVVAERFYGIEYTFWTKVDFRIEDTILTEGQAIRWFAFDEIKKMTLGYEDNAIIEVFFSKRYLTT